jgi:hypothetical protein
MDKHEGCPKGDVSVFCGFLRRNASIFGTSVAWKMYKLIFF